MIEFISSMIKKDKENIDSFRSAFAYFSKNPMYSSLNLETKIADRLKNYTSNGNLDFFSDKGIVNVFGLNSVQVVRYPYGLKDMSLTIENVMGATAVFWVPQGINRNLKFSNFDRFGVIVEFTNGSSITFSTLEHANYHLGAAYIQQVSRFFGAYHEEYISRLSQIVPILEPASRPAFYLQYVDPYTGLRLTREFVYLMNSDILNLFGNNPIIFGGAETYWQTQFGFALLQANLLGDSHILSACQLDALSIMAVLSVSIFAPTEMFTIEGQIYLHDMFQSVLDNNLIRLGDHPIDSGRVINYVLDINNEFIPLPVGDFGIPLGDALGLDPASIAYFLDEARLTGFGVIPAANLVVAAADLVPEVPEVPEIPEVPEVPEVPTLELNTGPTDSNNSGSPNSGFPFYSCIFGVLLVGVLVKTFFFSS